MRIAINTKKNVNVLVRVSDEAERDGVVARDPCHFDAAATAAAGAAI